MSVTSSSPLPAPRAGAPVGRFYAPELDLLRLFAFSLVFLRHVVTNFGLARQQQLATAARALGPAVAHAGAAATAGRWAALQGYAQSLDFGVSLFFFLSSYLITRLLLLEKAATGRVAIRDFYVRRSLRIWPLYFTFLAAMAAVAPLAPWLNLTAPRIFASLLFVANWPVVLHGWAGSPIELLWSVSVEEQFYLVWPQFARFGRKGVFAVSTSLAVVPFATLLWYSRTHAHLENTALWTNSLVQGLFFAGGALAACLLPAGGACRPLERGL
ncbi:MAG TPA: acyltransferase, partial [Acidobacteriaceae bacterium]